MTHKILLFKKIMMSNQVKQPVNFLCRLQQVTQNGKNAGERQPWKITRCGKVTTNRLAMESIVEAQSENPFILKSKNS